MNLDRSKPYGVVIGDPAMRYQQGGIFFDGSGKAIGGKAEMPLPPATASPSPAAPPPDMIVQDPDNDTLPSVDPKDLRGKGFWALRRAAIATGYDNPHGRKPEILAFLKANDFKVDE